MQNLSINAQKLLAEIKTRSLWEGEAINVLFPKPQYIGTLDPNYDTDTKIKVQTNYWQWEENLYGNGSCRPVNGSHVDFKMNVDKSYDAVTYEAVKELKAAGLLESKNGGFNNYSYHYIGN